MELKISQKQLENLLEEYKTTQINILSNKYNICIGTVRNYIRKYSNFRPRLDKQINSNIFNNLQDKDTQYWLGYLATDGSIFKDRVSLSQKYNDIDVIEKYSRFLGIDTMLVKRFHTKKEGKFAYVNRSFRNKEVTLFLESIGITENKSFTLNMKFPITFDFLRGAIDGDGCISVKSNNTKNRIRLASASEKFINQICSFLSSNNIDYKLYKTRNNLYEIHIHKKDSLLKLIDNLYYDNCTSMARKYNNAKLIRNNLNKTSETQGTIVKNPEASQQLIGE